MFQKKKTHFHSFFPLLRPVTSLSLSQNPEIVLFRTHFHSKTEIGSETPLSVSLKLNPQSLTWNPTNQTTSPPIKFTKEQSVQSTNQFAFQTANPRTKLTRNPRFQSFAGNPRFQSSAGNPWFQRPSPEFQHPDKPRQSTKRKREGASATVPHWWRRGTVANG